ncbi:MAG: hypothetical protein RL189_3077 [Pseudomonadota bacterium]
MAEYPKLIEILATFEERGQLAFTREQILQMGYPEKALQVALWRLQSQGKIVSPARGFFVLVGTPYRKVGSPPPTWYIDSWMKFKKLPYYVGLLSAAAFHGSSHHAVMETEVIVPRPIPEQEIGSARFRFFVKGSVEKTPHMVRDTPAGTVNISTPSATLFDLVTYAGRIGGINTVASVVAELIENVTLKEIKSCLKAMPVTQADLQRAGFLLERLSCDRLAAEVGAFLKGCDLHLVPLSCTNPEREGPKSARWSIIENETIEVES